MGVLCLSSANSILFHRLACLECGAGQDESLAADAHVLRYHREQNIVLLHQCAVLTLQNYSAIPYCPAKMT
jgi:hypothetical protein